MVLVSFCRVAYRIVCNLMHVYQCSRFATSTGSGAQSSVYPKESIYTSAEKFYSWDRSLAHWLELWFTMASFLLGPTVSLMPRTRQHARIMSECAGTYSKNSRSEPTSFEEVFFPNVCTLHCIVVCSRFISHVLALRICGLSPVPCERLSGVDVGALLRCLFRTQKGMHSLNSYHQYTTNNGCVTRKLWT